MQRMIAIGVAATVVLLLVLAQLFLPGIAAQQLRDRLSKNGRVVEVQISAFPAIELLWHDADRVVVRMASYRSGSGHLNSLLDEASNVGSLQASTGVLQDGLLTLRNATLSKHGDELTGSASVAEGDLRSAIPVLDSVEPITSSNGQLTLRGTGSLLGFTASADATVAAQNGKLVASFDVPFLPTLTLFSDPHVQIQSLAAAPAPGGFKVSAQARVG